MEKENILIESENKYIKKVKSVMIIAILVTIISSFISIMCPIKIDECWDKVDYITDRSSFSYSKKYTADYIAYKKYMLMIDVYSFMLVVGIVVAAIGGVVVVITIGLFFYARNMKIVVTNKRVYGIAGFDKQVDLPLDSISAIGKSFFNKGITVSTSSGRLSFIFISNRDEIYKVISELLINRQKSNQAITNNNVTSNAEEIKKYKELLDICAITEEEYNAKKKELLG